MIKYRMASVLDVPCMTKMWKLMMDEDNLGSVDRIDNEEMERFAFQITENLRSPLHVIVVAIDGDNVVGFTHANVFETLYGKPAIRLFSHSTFVYPIYRGEGVAISLTDEMLKIAKSRHEFEMIEFMCKYDDRIIQKWKSIGFKPDSIRMIRREV